MIDRQITAHETNNQIMTVNLKTVLDVVEDCGQYYRKASDSIKRAFNQAIFKKILVYPDGTIIPEYTEPYSALLKPLQAALCGGECEEATHTANSDSLPAEAAEKASVNNILGYYWGKIQNHLTNFFVGGLNKGFMVGLDGIEPSTKWL